MSSHPSTGPETEMSKVSIGAPCAQRQSIHRSGTSSYRCYYHPRPDAPADTGVLPSIRLKASSAERAAELAWLTLGKPIDRVERIEPPACAIAIEPPAEAPWPFGQLEPRQVLSRAEFERAMQADELRGAPSAFGVLA